MVIEMLVEEGVGFVVVSGILFASTKTLFCVRLMDEILHHFKECCVALCHSCCSAPRPVILILFVARGARTPRRVELILHRLTGPATNRQH